MHRVYISMAIDERSTVTTLARFLEIKAKLNLFDCFITNRKFSGQMSDESRIVEGNISDIKLADTVIVFFEHPDHRYVGCIGEMVYAKMFDKTVYVVDETKCYTHRPWIKYHSDIVFTREADLLSFLKSL